MIAARGDLDAAEAALADAAGAARSEFEAARALLALGQVRRRAKRKAPAREALVAARGRFRDCGALLWVRTADAELARVGGRPSRARELTPTERRVAELVVAGRSNKEVAAALFVTVSTVEAHLSRIYAKFGVRSRAQLAARGVAEQGVGVSSVSAEPRQP